MRPTREQILAAVLAAPFGLTTSEIAEQLCCSKSQVSTTVSKLAAYAEIGKESIAGNRQAFRWKRLPQLVAVE